MASYREIAVNGLWKNNPGLVQLLGLCPLLGVSNSMVNALGMGIATALVLAASNAAVALVRNQVTDAVRLPVFVMIIAALTTCIELLMQAFTYELYQILGIFIPLITTNCIILGRAEAFAAKTCLDLGLPPEMESAIAFKIRENIFRHFLCWMEEPSYIETLNNNVNTNSMSNADQRVFLIPSSHVTDMATNLWKRAKPSSVDDQAFIPMPLMPTDKDTNAFLWSH